MTLSSASDDPRFRSACLKLAWAVRHWESLRSAIDEYFRECPPKLVVYDDFRLNVRTLRLQPLSSIPPELSLLAGDIIQSARASLDHAVFALAPHDCKKKSQVQFPIAKTAIELDAEIRKRLPGFATDELTTALKKIMPYQGGNELLHGLHRAGVEDRHRLLIDADCGIEVSASELAHYLPVLLKEAKGKDATLIFGPDVSFQESIPNGSVRFTSDNQAFGEISISTTPRLLFGQDGAFPMKCVVSVLSELLVEVDTVLNIIHSANNDRRT